MPLTLGDIADMLQADCTGDRALEITGVCGIEEAGPGEITFVANPKYEHLLATTRASAVIVGPTVEVPGAAALRVADPYLAISQLLTHFATDGEHHTGRHPSAVVHASARVDAGAALHAGVVVQADAVVEAGAVLYPGVCVGERSRVGAGALIYPNVVIRHDVHIGERAILHSGVVLGSTDAAGGGTGASTAPPGPAVILEEDVELGAHATVDGGYERPTWIGAGTKMDNLVHVGAAADVGPGCLIVAQVGIGAGAVLEAGVTVAGQATILPNVRIGEGAIVTAKAGVDADMPPASMYSGVPARPHDQQRQVYAAIRRLPRSRQQLADLERRLRALEEATDCG